MMTLATWRREVAGLSLAAAAQRAGISQAHAASIEQHPEQASVGALLAYVAACGGRATITLECSGRAVELALA